MPSSTPQKRMATKKNNNKDISRTTSSVYTKSQRLLPLFKALWIYIVRYISYLYLLNPVYYIKQKEKILYYKDVNGNIPIKPRLKERILNLFLTEQKLRSNILSWAKSKVPDQSIEDFTSSWQDGISLCALLESVAPGSCPGYKNLKTHNRVNNCRLGIKLGHQYLQIPSDILTPEEMAIADKRTNCKIFHLISTIKWTSENRKVDEITIGDDTVVQPTSCCTVQGSGLKAGVVGRKMKFSLNISNVFGMFDLFIQLKGPRNEVYSEKIVSLHQSSDTILNNKSKITKRINNQDKKVQTSETKVLSYLEDGHGNTYVRWKNVKQYGAHAIYNVFDFNCTCNKEGSFSMSFTPVSAGIHTLSIRWQEQHVEGSPFKVKVYKLSDISRRGIADTKDKRVLFDSLSMSVENGHPIINEPGNLGTKDEKKQGNSLEINTKREKSSLQRMRKQYTITKRRILKKVIARNGEEIIITETPTPPLSRQSSFTDHSDYTDEDGSPIVKSRSRSSSPALLRAAKDLTDIRRQRSRSSSPSNDSRKKCLPAKSMSRINEKLPSPVLSSMTSSSLAIRDLDSNVSTDNDKTEMTHLKGTSNQISQKFLDSCVQSLGKHEYRPVRQNSDGAIPKSYRNGNKIPDKEVAKMFVLNRSLSESSLENKVLKRFFVCAQGNIMSREEADVESPLKSTGSPNLKLLHSGSLKKSCVYISQRAVNQTMSLASNDSRSDSSSGTDKASSKRFTERSKDTDVRSKSENTNSYDKTKTEETDDNDIHLEYSQKHPVNIFNNDRTSYTTKTPVAGQGRSQMEIIANKAHGQFSDHRKKLVHVLNINESYEKCNVEKWLESQKRKPKCSLEHKSYNSMPTDKVLNHRSMSNEVVKEKAGTIERSQSSDSKRGSLRKQSSVFPDTDSDPSLDDIHLPIKDMDGNSLCHRNEFSCPQETKHTDRFIKKYQQSSYCNDYSKERSLLKSYQTTVFRSIANGDANNNGQVSSKVAIVVPKVSCDKGTVVCAADIKQETSCYQALLNYNVLRKCIPMLKTPTETTRQDTEKIGRPGRSFSVDECATDISCLRTISDRYKNVRAWIEQNPHIRRGGPYRQSTVETIDSGMGDDNGIKTGRRASLYSHFRFPTDNQHQALCRRPYKGQIRLDPKLVQSRDSSEISNKESTDRSSDVNTMVKDNSDDGKTQSFDLLVECDQLTDNTSADVDESRKKISWNSCIHQANDSEPNNNDMLSKKMSSADSLQTLTTQRTSSSTSMDDMYCGFGINRVDRADLLCQLNNFRNMDDDNTNEDKAEQSLQTNKVFSDWHSGYNNFSSLSPGSDRSSSNIVSTPSGEISNLDINDSLDSSPSSHPERRYISSIERPFYLQVNDVIVTESVNDLNKTKDILECDIENENISTFSFDDSCCKADGTGLLEGHVGMKNNFQVWTNDPENGTLSVAIYGPKSHSVLETCVLYTGDNLYEVIYEVKHPGIYIICVKWSEQNIPNSPFTCRVTY